MNMMKGVDGVSHTANPKRWAEDVILASTASNADDIASV